MYNVQCVGSANISYRQWRSQTGPKGEVGEENEFGKKSALHESGLKIFQEKQVIPRGNVIRDVWSVIKRYFWTDSDSAFNGCWMFEKFFALFWRQNITLLVLTLHIGTNKENIQKMLLAGTNMTWRLICWRVNF